MRGAGMPTRRSRAGRGEAGFSLIEIIMAIVLIGIAVPAFTIYFSGLDNSKEPEYLAEGVFFGIDQMERIGDEPFLRIPTAGNYTCEQFRDWPADVNNVPVPNNFVLNVNCTNTQYDFNWTVSLVDAATPNNPGSGTFGKRVVLTVSRSDGGMPPFELVTLF